MPEAVCGMTPCVVGDASCGAAKRGLAPAKTSVDAGTRVAGGGAAPVADGGWGEVAGGAAPVADGGWGEVAGGAGGGAAGGGCGEAAPAAGGAVAAGRAACCEMRRAPGMTAGPVAPPQVPLAVNGRSKRMSKCSV